MGAGHGGLELTNDLQRRSEQTNQSAVGTPVCIAKSENSFIYAMTLRR